MECTHASSQQPGPSRPPADPKRTANRAKHTTRHTSAMTSHSPLRLSTAGQTVGIIIGSSAAMPAMMSICRGDSGHSSFTFWNVLDYHFCAAALLYACMHTRMHVSLSLWHTSLHITLSVLSKNATPPVFDHWQPCELQVLSPSDDSLNVMRMSCMSE
jgi:hypothetical protein